MSQNPRNTYKEYTFFFLMVQENYDKLLGKIASSAGLEKEELERRVEAKRAKLSGLISKEGAIQIIAAELGVSFDNEKFKINELIPGMRKVNLVGKVINLFPVRTFTRNDQESKVANLVVADETSNIKVVLWDVNHIELIEKGEVSEGKVIEILNATMRDNEVHLGSFSEFKLSSDVLENVQTAKVVKEKNIADFKMSDNVNVRAFIVQAFEPRFFNVCPECKKKVIQEEESFICKEHNKVIPEKRALINLVLDDGTETIRAVLFHDSLSQLGLTQLENTEELSKQKQEIIGKEMIFSGNVRTNKFFNNPEFVVDKVTEVNIGELMKNLEKNA
jgi:ssDNA-binding replication factor A large subunit